MGKASRPRRFAPELAAALALVLYLANGRTIGSGDTVGPALVPVSILTRGTVDLKQFGSLLAPPGMVPYFLHVNAAGVWPVYSIVPGILVTPLYVAPVWWHGRVARSAADWLRFALRWQKFAAAVVTAASVWVFTDLVLALGAPAGAALALAFAYAFGSEAWSVSAQALWQHGPAALALLVLARTAVGYRQRPASGVALAGGVALGLAAAVRPFTLVLALPVAVWGVGRCRRILHALAWGVPALALGATWLLYSRWVFGHSLGMYRDAFGWPDPAALYGLLASPARGLLPYFPAALLALPGVLVGRTTRWRGFMTALAVGAVGHLVLLTWHPDWGGGHGFGPRYMTEVEPVLLLLALPWILACRRDRLRTGVAAALVAWGVAVQSVGAFLYPGGCWDDDPVPVESDSARLWDWRDNPVFREIRTAVVRPARPSAPLSRWAARYRVPASLDLAPGASALFPVEVRNTGAEPWPNHGTSECACIVHLSWHLRDLENRFVRYEGTRAALGRIVRSGESVVVPLPVTAPGAEGIYLLEVTLVQERVAWFEDKGVKPARVLLRVRPEPAR